MNEIKIQPSPQLNRRTVLKAVGVAGGIATGASLTAGTAAATASLTVTITPTPVIREDLNLDEVSVVTLGDPIHVAMSGTTSAGSNLCGFAINFGDGSPPKVISMDEIPTLPATASHTYNQVGLYLVWIRMYEAPEESTCASAVVPDQVMVHVLVEAPSDPGGPEEPEPEEPNHGQNRIEICHNGRTLSVPQHAADRHIARGATLGGCDEE